MEAQLLPQICRWMLFLLVDFFKYFFIFFDFFLWENTFMES